MTDIPINATNGESRRPAPLLLTEKGQYIDFAVINEEKAPTYTFGTQERAMTRDGKPKTKDILTVLVIRGTGQIGRKDDRGTVVGGEVASVHIEGQDRWDPDADKATAKGEPKSWSGAKEDHGRLNVGDVVRWHFEGELQGKGAQPRKIRLFRLRGHRPDEDAQTERCRQLHRDGTDVPVMAGGHPEEDPF